MEAIKLTVNQRISMNLLPFVEDCLVRFLFDNQMLNPISLHEFYFNSGMDKIIQLLDEANTFSALVQSTS